MAVVGARGSVGALCARLLQREQPAQLVLWAVRGEVSTRCTPSAMPCAGRHPIRPTARRISPACPSPSIVISDDLHLLRDCSLVLTASGAGARSSAIDTSPREP